MYLIKYCHEKDYKKHRIKCDTKEEYLNMLDILVNNLDVYFIKTYVSRIRKEK